MGNAEKSIVKVLEHIQENLECLDVGTVYRGCEMLSCHLEKSEVNASVLPRLKRVVLLSTLPKSELYSRAYVQEIDSIIGLLCNGQKTAHAG